MAARGRRAAALALAVAANAGVAVQSRFHGELGARLHDGLAPAVISFGSGALLLALLMLLLPAGRRGLAALRGALRDGTLRWWHCLGGLIGALFVVSQGVTVDALGVAVFTVAAVAGLSGSSLVVDRLGIGPGGRRSPSAARVLGAALAVVAVVVATSDRLSTPKVLALAALPAIAGLLLAWQQAALGQVRVHARSTLTATFLNFAVGAVALLLAFAVDVAVRGWPSGALPREPWLYTGGLIGFVVIMATAAAVRHTGVLLLSLGSIAGQLLGAVAVDIVAPGTHGRPGATTLVGVALTLVAVGVAAMPRRPWR